MEASQPKEVSSELLDISSIHQAGSIEDNPKYRLVETQLQEKEIEI